MSTYTVKTRTEKRLRTRDVTTTAAHLDVRPLEEHVVYIAELFAGDVVVDSGEGATDNDAFDALDRELSCTWQALVVVHRDKLNALHSARYGEVPFG